MSVGIESSQMRAPFPWFGGKMRAASLIWERLGADVPSYVEPFAGSLAVLLQRPGGAGKVETVNDADGLLCNFWRALSADPNGLAREVDWPVNECDLSARHLRLVGERARVTERLQIDPDWYDLRLAAWWVWGINAWIGSGWCAGDGPWLTDGERWVRADGNPGRGVNRQLPHLGNPGRGVNRKLPHLGNSGRGVNRVASAPTAEWFAALSSRLRSVRVACGDWRRVVSDSVLHPLRGQPCAALLDPPYPEGWDTEGAYSAGSSGDVWHEVAEWAVEAAKRHDVRVALCGYEGLWSPPSGWSVAEWRTKGGYGGGLETSAAANQSRERVWFSPACLRPANEQLRLL